MMRASGAPGRRAAGGAAAQRPLAQRAARPARRAPAPAASGAYDHPALYANEDVFAGAPPRPLHCR